MKPNKLFVLLAAAACLLTGCSKPAPDADALLSQARQALADLDSYSLRMTVDIRATPADGDGVAQPSYCLDTYSRITDGCQAMSRSAQYTVYKDWSWYLSSSTDYQYPRENGNSDYYYTCDGDYSWAERPTVDYRLDLDAFYADVTASSVRYDGSPAYLLTGSLGDARLEQLLPPDGTAGRILREIPETATVRTYLNPETCLPITTEIAWEDPDGAILEAMDCEGGRLNICRISLTYNSFNALEPLELPEALSDPEKLPEIPSPALSIADGAAILANGVRLPLPPTYTLATLASSPTRVVLQQFNDGNSYRVVYQLTDVPPTLADCPDPLPEGTILDRTEHTMEPLDVEGRTVNGSYETCKITDDSGANTFCARYCFYVTLPDGSILQCTLRNTTANENVFKPNAEAFARQLFTGIA